MADEATTFDVVVTRVFDAPLERVWRAWTEPELVRRWWGPVGFSAPLARMDVRPGGTSLVCMRSPDGHDLYNTWTYGQVVPGERLEFVLRFSDESGDPLDPARLGLPPGIPAEVPHVITFTDVNGRGTRITVTESGYGIESTRDGSRIGLEQCLDKMTTALTDGDFTR
ncbi:SRPBCC family protein [Nonomuraea lactucae]|uniref:SRPBCC family protein n=1 Tax=Nonomuraea lactucae TaxID=2249762 RepID=UPI000DE41160|nr:SRPBCC domain-containing protein [Nonomuraea lactucae]